MKKSVSVILLIFAVSLLFCIYSRGFFELIDLSKNIGYIFSILSFVIIIAFAVISYWKRKRPIITAEFLQPLFFMFVALLSVLITGIKYQIWIEPFVYVLIIFFIYWSFVWISSFEFVYDTVPRTLFHAVFIMAAVLFVAALWEQSPWFPILTMDVTNNNRLITPGFPGHSSIYGTIVRPASLTGSMLHYPIIIPLFGAVILRFGNKWRKIAGVIFFLAPLLTFSRSGILIVLIAGLLFLIYMGVSHIIIWLKKTDSKLILRKLIPFFTALIVTAFCIILLYLFISPVRNFLNIIGERLTDLNAQGNVSRFIVWSEMLDRYLKTNMIIGEMTGFYTNITGNIFGLDRMHAFYGRYGPSPESGFLEILTGFGFLGVAIFYGTFISVFYRLFFKQKEHFLSFVFLAAVIQSLFYQSIEVLPFMFALGLIPFFVNNKPGGTLFLEEP